MISYRRQIDKATNLVKEVITPLSEMTEQICRQKSVGILNKKTLEQTT